MGIFERGWRREGGITVHAELKLPNKCRSQNAECRMQNAE
jgi:hypothetical protein